MRIPALIAGIFIIPATYFLFRTIANNYAAILSATIVSLSSPLIEYSTNARGYATINLIFLILLLLADYLAKNRNIFAWSIFIILSALGFYTIPVFLLPFGIVICWYILIVTFNNIGNRLILLKDLFLSILFIILSTFILYLPIIVVSGYKSLIDNPYVQSNSFNYFMHNIFPSLRSTMAFYTRDMPLLVIVLLSIGFVVLILKLRYFDKKIPLLLISSFIWCITVIMVKLIIIYPRMWLFLIPVFIGFSCTGLVYIIRKLNNDKVTMQLSIILSVLLLITLTTNILVNNSIYYSDTTPPLLVDGNDIVQYLKKEINLGDGKTYVGDLLHRSQLLYYFKKNNLPVKQLLKYNSVKDVKMISQYESVIVIDNGPNQTKESVLKELGFDINTFNHPVLLKRYKIASIYVYNKNKGQLLSQ